MIFNIKLLQSHIALLEVKKQSFTQVTVGVVYAAVGRK